MAVNPHAPNSPTMTPPNRADHPNRKMGDHTTPTGQYILTVHNSNSPSTFHPTEDHAIKQAAYVGAQENRKGVRATIRNAESGHSTTLNVQSMNEAAVASHKDAVKTGKYKYLPAK